MFIFILLIIIITISISVYNSIIAIQKLKKRVLITNGVLYSIIALLIIFFFVDESITDRDSLNYDIYGRGILGQAHYDKTEDNYYIIKNPGWLSPYTEIAVPKDNAKISVITLIYDPIIVYCNKDTDLYSPDNSITINFQKYYLSDTIIKIRPNYFDLIFFIEVIDIALLFLFNMVFILHISKKADQS